MIYKLISNDKANNERKGALRGSGWHYNDFPPNMRECSPAEFWHVMGTYFFSSQEHRQPSYERSEDMPYGGFWGNLTILYTDSQCTEGYAFTTHWDHTHTKAGGTAPYDFWPRFFKFGVCIHKYTGKKIGNCLTKYTCEKCGKTYEIDSSD